MDRTEVVRQQMLQEAPEEDLFGAYSDDDEDYIISESESESDEESYLDDEETYSPSRNVDVVSRRTGRPKSIIEGKDGYKLSINAPESRGRRSLRVHLAGAKDEAKLVSTPLESWSLLLPDELLNVIVLHTNEEIDRKVLGLDAQTYHGHIDLIELKAFLGLLYFSGAQKDQHKHTENMWAEHSCALYRAVMCRNRFVFLSSCIRFDDKGTRSDRKKDDRLAALREIWDAFIENCTKYYNPSSNCTIDEQLLGFRGNFFARIYIPSKPDKYGIKILCLNDSKTFYMLNAIPYTGKVANSRLESIPTYYVRELSKPIYDTGRNITCDNTILLNTAKYYSTCRATSRWTMRLFFGILDQAVVNCNILYHFNVANTALSRYKFIESLALSLVSEEMKRRLEISTLRKSVRSSICSILQINDPGISHEMTDRLEKRKRCYFCPSDKDKKATFCCCKCKKPVCEKHKIYVCKDCIL